MLSASFVDSSGSTNTVDLCAIMQLSMKKRAVEYLQHKLEYEAKTYTKKKLQAKNK